MALFMNIRKEKYYKIRLECLTEEYHQLYRFSENNVEWLAEQFLEESQETRGGALSTKKQMQLFLRCLSSPGFQVSVAKEEGVHRTSVCKNFGYVLERVCEKADMWIKFPRQEDYGRMGHKVSFSTCFWCYRLYSHGNSKTHGDEYYNRKGYFSINIQATCNANEEFTSIDSQWPGSVHDNRILKQSDIYRSLNAFHQHHNQRYFLLGDVGYGITPWLMTPFKQSRTREQVEYNSLHKRERVIERCFGQLKKRFPILKYGIRVLHNIAKFLKDDLPNDEADDIPNDLEDEEVEAVEDELENTLRLRGQRTREEITNIIHQLNLIQ